jgi:tRNA(fMet)-specific endonuclease VapC
MGLLIDSSVFIAAERGHLSLARHLPGQEHEVMALSAITASELLHGVHRAAEPPRRVQRERFVEAILARFPVVEFGLEAARVHARLWAELVARGEVHGHRPGLPRGHHQRPGFPADPRAAPAGVGGRTLTDEEAYEAAHRRAPTLPDQGFHLGGKSPSARDSSFLDALVVTAALHGRTARILSEDLNPGQTIEGVLIEHSRES